MAQEEVPGVEALIDLQGDLDVFAGLGLRLDVAGIRRQETRPTPVDPVEGLMGILPRGDLQKLQPPLRIPLAEASLAPLEVEVGFDDVRLAPAVVDRSGEVARVVVLPCSRVFYGLPSGDEPPLNLERLFTEIVVLERRGAIGVIELGQPDVGVAQRVDRGGGLDVEHVVSRPFRHPPELLGDFGPKGSFDIHLGHRRIGH